MSPNREEIPKDELVEIETGLSKKPTHFWRRNLGKDPPMFLATLAGVIVVAGATVLTQISSCQTDEKINKLVLVASDLASSSKAQATQTGELKKATQDFSRAMARQADSTKSLAESAAKSATSSQISAVAATGQLNEMQNEQRPELVASFPINVAPLIFSEKGAATSLLFPVRNSGKSTARYSQVRARFFLAGKNDVLEMQAKACATKPAQQHGSSPFGFSIAPSELVQFPKGILMSPDDVQAWKSLPINDASPRPMLAGCVQYTYQGKEHHTPFVFEVDKRSDKYPQGFEPIDPNKDLLQPNMMIFLIPPWYNGKSD